MSFECTLIYICEEREEVGRERERVFEWNKNKNKWGKSKGW